MACAHDPGIGDAKKPESRRLATTIIMPSSSVMVPRLGGANAGEIDEDGFGTGLVHLPLILERAPGCAPHWERASLALAAKLT